MKENIINIIRAVPISGKTYEEYVEAVADRLCSEDYRKASDVASEIFEDFLSILFSIMYLSYDGKYHLRKMNADKVTLIVEKYIELKKKYTQDKGRDKIAEFGKYSPLSWRNTEERE